MERRSGHTSNHFVGKHAALSLQVRPHKIWVFPVTNHTLVGIRRIANARSSWTPLPEVPNHD
jgi:hypothetical protein